MTRGDDTRLDDILDAATLVADIVGRGKAAFGADIALQRALERCFEIIGDAAKSLSDETRRSLPDVAWPEMIRLRDRLSHHYHRIESEQLWVTAQVELPRAVAMLVA